jgi:hypothetical protein
MTLPKNLGMTLLAVWLILYGAFTVLSLNFNGSGYVLPILAIVVGVLLLLGK